MLDRAALPLQEAAAHVQRTPDGDPLPQLRSAIQLAFEKTVHDPLTRRVFEVATHKVEYVDSLCAVRARHLRMRDAWLQVILLALRRSAEVRGIRLPLPEDAAAQGLQALADGLLQNWLLEPGAFDLEAVGKKAVDAYLRGLGLT